MREWVDLVLELTYPPLDSEAAAAEMRAAIDAQLPVGRRLTGLDRPTEHRDGPTLREDLSGVCWRMHVSVETEGIEPLVWEGVD